MDFYQIKERSLKNGVIEITTKSVDAKNAIKQKLAADKEDIFVVVEDQPQFKGGTEALMKYLGDNIKYPKEAHEKNIQGRVIANFVINKDGTLSIENENFPERKSKEDKY